MIFVILLAGCVKHVPAVTSGPVDPGLARAVRTQGVSIAPVVVLQDLPAPPMPAASAPSAIEQGLREGEEQLPDPTVLDPTSPRDAAFLRNEYLGNIRFGGGFIRTGDVTLEVRARLIELGLEDRYREEGVRWLGEMVPEALADLKVPVDAPAAARAPVPERRRFRGLHEEDGHDNVNLPRSELAPIPVEPFGNGYVLVPYLRAYYTHNGGWFLGQTWGCTAGARVEAFLVLYDAGTGRPAWSAALTGSHIEPRNGQPSTAEMDQFLLWAEGQAREQLERAWLR